ncbi:MAG: PP2C family protein-serine/threonine phosphatase [Crocinitomicaceae bacterium]
MSFSRFWRKISLIGLSADEEFEKREVVLLNKLTTASIIVMLPVIPLEVMLNGWELIPYELVMYIIMGFTLVLNYYRKFLAAKVYFIVVAVTIIVIMGTMVGHGSYNEFFLIPVFILPAMLFNKKWLVLLFSFFVLAGFFGVEILQKNIPPLIELEDEVKKQFSYIFLSIIFILIYFAIYYFKNINLSYQKVLAGKNEEINEKNKEIVDSINYAKRIQDAYLPRKDLLQMFFTDSFLFFEPKDIVSGDFYWFFSPGFKKDSKDNEVFVVAADCTGHGVPGAIMSVICATALNDVIVTQKNRNTGDILDKVREHVVQILKADTEHKTKDGMDAVICKINPEKQTVQYSGAQNPLWILRKESDQIDTIKADKQPVGAYENSKPFTTHDIQLSKGDQIYFFSDGFQDQFGGDKGKKYKAANLKKLILEHRQESMSKQQEILSNEFQRWKGDLEQVDDVCVIGVRL